MKVKTYKQEKNKQFLALFLVILPSLLIAMTSAISETTIRLFFQVVLILFQVVVVKNMVEDYY